LRGGAENVKNLTMPLGGRYAGGEERFMIADGADAPVLKGNSSCFNDLLRHRATY
jgi:hypothetical protein